MSKGEEREKAYNRTREKEYIASRIQSDEQFVEEMRKLYRESMRQIEDDMARWLGRYATIEGISYDEALARAAKTDVKALAAKAKKYVKEKNFSEIANEMLRRYNLRLRMSRAELLHHEMELELIALGDAEAKLTGSYLAQQYFEEIDRQAGILRMSIPEKEHLLNQARSVVDSSWKNATWSQRIWKNNEDLRAELGKGLRASMLEGRNPRDWANKLQRVLQKAMVSRKGRGNAEFLSERLAITEAGRVQIEAQLRSFDAMGYDALEVITEPGACAECLPHDGEIVPLKDARMGENIPMFHPFCRCSTAAHVNRLDVEHMFAELERSDTSLTDAERFRKSYEGVKANTIAGIHREDRGMVAKNGEIGYNKHTEIIDHRSTPRLGEPFSIVDRRKEPNQKVVSRTFYDERGIKDYDIHTTDHGNAKQHPFGRYGEHVTKYVWDEAGRLIGKTNRELTEKERSENNDIL